TLNMPKRKKKSIARSPTKRIATDVTCETDIIDYFDLKSRSRIRELGDPLEIEVKRTVSTDNYLSMSTNADRAIIYGDCPSINKTIQKHEPDLSEVLTRAKNAGVEKIIVTGGSLSESKQSIKLAESAEGLFATVGCHPTRCNEFLDNNGGSVDYLNQLLELAKSNPKVVAIGEIGLDYDRLHFCSREIQKRFFTEQLSMAESTGLPLFLHNRNSIDDFMKIMESNRDKFTSGVVHSFDGTCDDAKRVLDLGLYIGVNGCSLKTEANLEVASKIPSDRLMIETDCPWCGIKSSHASFKFVKTRPLSVKREKHSPDKQVKDRNEPENIVQVFEVLSAIREEDSDKLAQQLYENTQALFFRTNRESLSR
ncbi:putative deoxyribonuclease TATDN1, partial [Fragariocoptes setiger]